VTLVAPSSPYTRVHARVRVVTAGGGVGGGWSATTVVSWPDLGTVAAALTAAQEAVPKPFGCGGASANFACSGHGTCSSRGLCTCESPWRSEGGKCALDFCSLSADRSVDPNGVVAGAIESGTTEEISSRAEFAVHVEAGRIASGSSMFPWFHNNVWNRRRRTRARGACNGHGVCASQKTSPLNSADSDYSNAQSNAATMTTDRCTLAEQCPGTPTISAAAENTCTSTHVGNTAAAVCLRALCRCAAGYANAQRRHQQWVGTIDDTCICDAGWWGSKCEGSGPMTVRFAPPDAISCFLLYSHCSPLRCPLSCLSSAGFGRPASSKQHPQTQ